jgi:hypothetical protein
MQDVWILTNVHNLPAESNFYDEHRTHKPLIFEDQLAHGLHQQSGQNNQQLFS